MLERAGLGEVVSSGDFVAVKLHFGEQGNTGFVQPVFAREVVKRIKGCGGKPFLTDANTLYSGQRWNAVDHIACALHNGFSYATVEAPIIIADGLAGAESCEVTIDGYTHFDSVRIGSAVVHADALVVVSHVKGHEEAGFGGALKNIGMGFGCRSAKQRMHADFKPVVIASKCTACRRCVLRCSAHAMTMDCGSACINTALCNGCGECVASCPTGAIATQWDTSPQALQEKIVEHAAGVLAGKQDKAVYLSFVTNVSPDCDCWSFSDAPLVADIGVLASTDPVAIDRAAYDMVTAAPGLPGGRAEGLPAGSDKFIAVSGVDGTRVICYAAEHGLGSEEYELRSVGERQIPK